VGRTSWAPGRVNLIGEYTDLVDDRVAFGRLFRAGHESLRLDLEVTTPELDQLVELAYAHGAVAARMSGAGFGGAVVALGAETRTTPFVQAVLADYGGQGRAYVCRASDGAGLHS
jgi:galactokinase